jgi:hypothetical protein
MHPYVLDQLTSRHLHETRLAARRFALRRRRSSLPRAGLIGRSALAAPPTRGVLPARGWSALEPTLPN